MQQSNIQGIDLSPYKTATLNHLHECSKLKAIHYLFYEIKEAGFAPTIQDTKKIVEKWEKEFNEEETERITTEATDLQAQNEALRKDIEGLVKERDELVKALKVIRNRSTFLDNGVNSACDRQISEIYTIAENGLNNITK